MPTYDPPFDAHSGSGPTIFSANEIVMKKRILSLREHYDIEDGSENRLAEGEGNLIQLPANFRVWDPRSSQEIMRIEGKLFSIHNQYTFKDNLGVELGTIRKKVLKLFGDEFWIDRNGQEIMHIQGNFWEHEYDLEMNGKVVAHVHRDWLSLRDRYGITILGEVDRRLVIGAAIVIEHIEVEERRSSSSG
jgi:uncharacterized protein YxjI